MWIPDDNEVWVSAVVMRAYTDGDNCLHLEREDGQVRAGPSVCLVGVKG